MKKVFKIILNIIKWMCLITFGIYISILVVQKVTNNKASLAGYRVFTVISGSMVPKYNIGDILIIQEKPINEIKVGDDLCYLGKEADFNNKVVTHAVKEVKKNEDGTISFITEGIANVMPDPEVDQSQVYGIVTHKTVILSFIGKCLSNKFIFFLIIFVPIFGYIIVKILKVINEVTKDDEDEEEQEE